MTIISKERRFPPSGKLSHNANVGPQNYDYRAQISDFTNSRKCVVTYKNPTLPRKKVVAAEIWKKEYEERVARLTHDGRDNQWNKAARSTQRRPKSAFGVRSTSGYGLGFSTRPFVSPALSCLERCGLETPGPGRYGKLSYEPGGSEYVSKMKRKHKNRLREWTRRGNTRPVSASGTIPLSMRNEDARGDTQRRESKLGKMQNLYRRPSLRKRLEAIPSVDIQTAVARATKLTSREPRRKKTRPNSAYTPSPSKYATKMNALENTHGKLRKQFRPRSAPAFRASSNSILAASVSHSMHGIPATFSTKRGERPSFPTKTLKDPKKYDKYVAKVPPANTRAKTNRGRYMTGSPIIIQKGVSQKRRCLLRVRQVLRESKGNKSSSLSENFPLKTFSRHMNELHRGNVEEQANFEKEGLTLLTNIEREAEQQYLDDEDGFEFSDLSDADPPEDQLDQSIVSTLNEQSKLNLVLLKAKLLPVQ